MAMPLTLRRFTIDEYHHMGRVGILDEDDRVELADGQIVEMSPIGPEHAGCVAALTGLLSRRVGDQIIVWVQNPVDLDERSELQPDVALLAPRADTYRTAHPHRGDILLVIEVADTSLKHDRDVKVPLYAAADVPEVWLVNLPEDVVTLYHDPRGAGYATVGVARRGDTLTPIRLPSVTLRVDDILG
jgi:Uma2 family endonuclease